MKQLKSRTQILVVLVTLAALLSIASPHFLSGANLLNTLQQSSINALLGMGLTLVIISGGIDLSVGSILALAGIITADLLVKGLPTAIAILAGLAVGLGCGLVNGLVTTLTRIPPFVTTLGMMLVARSAAKIYSGAHPISGLPAEFRALAGDVAGVPNLVLVVLATFVVAYLVLTRTKLGRYTYAIGGNEQAAWLSGVPVGTYKVAIYALSGLLAGVAAVLMTARLNAASPLAGDMYELYAIAAAVIGGVSLTGGEGGVVGTLLGALIMGMLRNGLNLLNVPSAWEGIIIGAVLVTAVVVDRARHSGGRQAGARATRPRLQPWRLAAAGVAVALLTAGAFTLRQGQAVDADAITVAFVPKAMDSPFWTAMQDGAEAEARRLGVRLLTLAPERETDVERQFQIVENLIQQRVDAIVMAPSGSRELVAGVKKANEAGIPVFIVDTRLDPEEVSAAGAHIASFVGSDNFAGGLLAGRQLGARLGGVGDVAIIEGIAGHETSDQRRLGFLKALAEFPRMRVVASLTGNFERQQGYTVTENLLQAHPGLRAIFAANDAMALGALEALDAARRLDQVQVVGFDAVPDAVANIRSGRMLGSVAQFPDKIGATGVRLAVGLLRDEAEPPSMVTTQVAFIERDGLQEAP